MNILFLSQYYPPESNAPANRVSQLARHWTRLGADVTVLTGFPNHPEGRVYPGYSPYRPLQENDHGVRVVRTPIYTAANRGVVRRSAAYASYCASASTFGPWLTPSPDVVIATSPQLLVGVAGAWMSLLRHRPFVLEVRDLWPDSVVAVGALPERHPVVRGLHGIERALYAQAHHIVVVTESFRDILVERGVPRERISFLPNGVDADLFSPGAPERTPGDDPETFVVTFAGTIGMAHDLGTLLDAAAKLRDHRDIEFRIVGEGAERANLERRATEMGLPNVRFFGRVPREAIPGMLRRADLSLIMLRDSPLFRTVLPSKIFEAMGCGRPILLGVDGEARRLVERAGAGRFFQPGDADALAEAVLQLKADPQSRQAMGQTGRAFVMEHFDRRKLSERYLDTLRSVAKGETLGYAPPARARAR